MIDSLLARIEYLRAKVERLTEENERLLEAADFTDHSELAMRRQRVADLEEENLELRNSILWHEIKSARLRDEVKRLRNRCAQDERLRVSKTQKIGESSP